MTTAIELGVLVVVFVVALAVHQTVNILRYSSLFAWLRDRIELDQPIWDRLPRKLDEFLRQLLQCPWCLSIHLSTFYTFWWFLPDKLVLPVVMQFVTVFLAVSQVANLLHHWFHHRGPK